LLKTIWIFLLFKANWDTFLTLNYQLGEIFYFISNSSYFHKFEFFYFCISKILPYIIDFYIIFLILFLIIFSCLGKKIVFLELITYKTVSNCIFNSLKFYFYFFLCQYCLFCYDIKVGPVYFSNTDYLIFGQVDNWVLITKFLFIIFFFLFFIFLENLFLITKIYSLSYEVLIFLLISFELLLIIISSSNLLILDGSICRLSIVTYILIAFVKT
jgi:hypothetical protein